ncbi:MAG: flagellar motor switch protein FliM [Armatimonadota bacterium]
MADVLSQDEINALLETYESTNAADGADKGTERTVRLYDFARPDKFSKDHLRTLNMIHSKHGAAFGGSLAGLLRVASQVELLALDQLTYREYAASVPNTTLFVEVELEPLSPLAIFEFNPSFVATCVDLLAGGTVVNHTGAISITDIDKAIVVPVVELALKKYVDAWSQFVNIEFKILSMSTDSTTRQVLLPSEAVLVCGYEITVGEHMSMMSVCIPTVAIETVLPKLSVTRAANTSSKQFEKANEALKRSFEQVELNVKAYLGRTSLSFEDIINLEVGDLIRLPTKSNGEVEVRVEDISAFCGILGSSDGNLAVQITRKTNDLDTDQLLGGQ